MRCNPWFLFVLVFITLACNRIVHAEEEASVSATPEGQLKERTNNLKQIGVGFETYRTVFKSWPISPRLSPECFDKDGRPFVSWRVYTLPFTGQAALFDKFNLKERWDSESNLKLAEQIPPYLKRPGLGLKTPIVAFRGPGAFQEGQAAPSDWKDAIANTIFVVEAGDDKAVFWTKPDDLAFDPKDPKLALGKLKDDFFLALLGDGRVVKLKKDIPGDSFHALITRSGGEKVNWMDFAHK